MVYVYDVNIKNYRKIKLEGNGRVASPHLYGTIGRFEATQVIGLQKALFSEK